MDQVEVMHTNPVQWEYLASSPYLEDAAKHEIQLVQGYLTPAEWEKIQWSGPTLDEVLRDINLRTNPNLNLKPLDPVGRTLPPDGDRNLVGRVMPVEVLDQYRYLARWGRRVEFLKSEV